MSFLPLVQPAVRITTSGNAIYSEPFQITCRASLRSAVATHLIQYLMVNWTIENYGPFVDISVDEEQTDASAVTRTVTFEPLNVTHGGNYTCEAKLKLPDTTESFNSDHLYQLIVLSKSLFMYILIFMLTLHYQQTELSFN